MPENDIEYNETNMASWVLQVDLTEVLITHIKDEGFFFELNHDEGKVDNIHHDLEDAITAGKKHLDDIRAALDKFRQDYKPVEIKDATVDIWYTNELGEEVEDVIEVSWEVQQKGAAYLESFIDERFRQLESEGNSDTGCTHTW